MASMLETMTRRRMNLRCERLHQIKLDSDSSTRPPGTTGEELSFLLRRAIAVRDRDPLEFQHLLQEIIGRESYAVKQQVALAGVRRDGRSWVAQEAIEDVTGMALTRLSKFILNMEGSSVGELRSGIRTCVRYAVVDYIRDDQRHESVPVDPGHFTDALSPEQTQYSELLGLAASTTAEDRADFKQRLELLGELDPREAEVVIMRGRGYPSKAVAEHLGISPANVDQIYHRATVKLDGMDQ